MKRRRLLSLALGAGLPVAGPSAASTGPGPALAALADRYMDALLDADPFWASALGVADEDQAARLPMGIAADEVARMNDLRRHTLQALDRLDSAGLDGAQRITAAVLRHHAADGLAMAAYPDHLLAVHHMPSNAAFLLASAEDNGLSRFASAQDHRLHLRRLAALPAWCEQAAANFRQGLARGVTLPTVILERMLPMLRAMAEPGSASPFLRPLRRLPAGLPPAERTRLAADYEATVRDRVAPALAELARVLAQDILPRSRSSSALAALPQGAEWYEQCIRSRTTTALSAREVHALGLQEVQRLRGEVARMARAFAFSGPVEDFLGWHAARPESRPFRTEAEVLRAYRAIDAVIAPQLPRLLTRQPRAGFEIRPEPQATRASANDHYTAPSADGQRPGVFFAAIDDPLRYGSPLMTTMLLHEGRPGHHCQIALAQEMPLTRLQRFWFNDAYGEGWALYAETLGHELGLYEDRDAYVGHLSLAMLRAVRLVVDTAVHTGRWTREAAIDYLRRHTGFGTAAATAQIDRYIVFPGQSLSYALGRIRIEQLRDEARATLGPRFRLAAFHDAVLGSGTLPLSVLADQVRRWAAGEKA